MLKVTVAKATAKELKKTQLGTSSVIAENCQATRQAAAQPPTAEAVRPARAGSTARTIRATPVRSSTNGGHPR
jgi:hypothetical protein